MGMKVYRTEPIFLWCGSSAQNAGGRRRHAPPRAALSGWPSPAAPLPSRAPSPLLHPPSSGPRGGAVTARALCGREGEKEGEGSKGGKNGRESRRGVGGAAAGHGGMRGRAYLVELWGVCGQGEGGLGASASSPPRKAFRSKGGDQQEEKLEPLLLFVFGGGAKGGEENGTKGVARARKREGDVKQRKEGATHSMCSEEDTGRGRQEPLPTMPHHKRQGEGRLHKGER